MECGITAEPGRPGHAVRQVLQLLAGVGRIGGDADPAARQFRREPGDHAAGQPQPGGGRGALDHQLRHHRHRYGTADHGQPDPDRQDHPVVPEACLRWSLRAPVMKPRCCPHALAPSPEQGVVDDDLHGIPVRHEQGDDQLRGAYPQVIGVPPGTGEEIVRPVVRPQPRQARPRQHAAHRPLPGLREETAGQGSEGTERRGGEQRRERGQHRHQRRRHRCRGIRKHQREPVPSHGEAAGRAGARRP
jgi:hypothetical protein